MEVFDLEQKFKRLYSVDEVTDGYRYWYSKLLGICIQMFEYGNLPSGLNARELELNLMITGHAVVLANPKRPGQLFTPLTSLGGVNEYYQPEWAVWANPAIPSTGRQYMLSEDCVNIWNNDLHDNAWYLPLDGSMHTFIARYSRKLADLESTASICTVNGRLLSIPVSNDSSVIESFKLFIKKLAAGRRSIVTDSTIVEKFRNIDITRTGVKEGILDWLIARDKVLEQFYREIGIRMNNQKKAQVNEEEIEANDQLLLIPKDVMFRCRKEGIEEMNYMFGTEATVKVNPLFDVSQFSEGVQSNE